MLNNKYPQRIGNNCIWRTVDNETVILADNAKTLHTLNEVAGEIWRLADGTKSVNDIVSKITAEFDIDSETAFNDVETFISKLCDLNLIIVKMNSTKDGKEERKYE
jgi:predicted transcriptional regulator